MHETCRSTKRCIFCPIQVSAPADSPPSPKDLFTFGDALVRFERDVKGRMTAMRWLLPGGGIRFVRR